MEIFLLHQTYPGQTDPPNRPYPADQAQIYRALLHQRGPPHLINPRWRCIEPYYTSQAPLLIYPYYTKPEMEIALLHQYRPLANLPQREIALLHQREISPSPTANLPQMEIALLHQTGPLLIYPRWTLPYYPRQALPSSAN